MNKIYTSNLLNKSEVKTIIKVFEKEGVEIRLVGGCVRDIFLNKISKDIDFAVKAKPEETVNILKKNKFKYNNYAKKYGSITAYLENKKIEITSLREDINQRGRGTQIVYTRDWVLDAKRRDFTINSIYLKSDGNFIDYFNGINDLKEKKIKFIGEIEKRIKEDFLRIFRYYRFLGIFEKPNILDDYDNIISLYCTTSFNYLSNDLLLQEILKMFDNPYPQNSFYIDKVDLKKRLWLKLVEKHFKEKKYNIGLEKCSKNISLLIKNHKR